jgi:hypothetical protein
MSTAPPPAARVPPTIHEAALASGPSGAVEWGAELTLDQAVNRRRSGEDVVVRSDDEIASRRLAGAIELAVGLATKPQPPHTYSAGPHALPHFHQRSRVPAGHTFYESKNRKARRKR